MDILVQIKEFLYTDNAFALFLIIAIGFMVGKISVKGISLDVSAIIFVALIFGHFGVKLPSFIQSLGLVLFIFTIGIQAGPGFFDAMKKHGIHLAVLAFVLIFTAAVVTIICSIIFDIKMDMAVGLLTGALTSTPGLAVATERFGGLSSIGYGIAYPFGVIGVILFLRMLPQLFKINITKAEQDWEQEAVADYPLVIAKNLEVTNTNINGKSLSLLRIRSMTHAVISRVMHEDYAITPTPLTSLFVGDYVRIVGTEEALEKAKLIIGKETDKEIPLSGNYDVQGILVTNKEVVNKTMSELNLHANYGATVTRIRRSGIDITPEPNSRIRFGDKLIVACDKENMKQVITLFGNDDKRLSDTDFLPIAIGIVLGVLVGKFTPLGLTGGVLLVAILLSKIGKTGPILWTMSSSANMLLRELGLIFFLAVVGTDAGAHLGEIYNQYGYKLFLIGAGITLLPMIVTSLFAKWWYKINILTLLGTLAGGMTSTPGLAAVNPMTKANAPQIAYATVYPIAMVLLVISIQLLSVLF